MKNHCISSHGCRFREIVFSVEFAGFKAKKNEVHPGNCGASLKLYTSYSKKDRVKSILALYSVFSAFAAPIKLFSTLTVTMQKSMKIVFDDGIFALLNHVLTIYAVPLRSVLNSYNIFSNFFLG